MIKLITILNDITQDRQLSADNKGIVHRLFAGSINIRLKMFNLHNVDTELGQTYNSSQ